MSKYVLAIDQGTTGTTVVLVDESGRIKTKINAEYPQIYPKPGWVEHDPENIWQSVLKTIREALKEAKVDGKQIIALGITNQRETVVVWDRHSHRPIYNAIVWQCRRTQSFCEKLKRQSKENLIRKKTGLVIDPYFSASKINWILNHVPGAKQRTKNKELAAGTIDSFLLWRLSQGAAHKTDVSNASRTQLMNIHTGQWDSELAKLFSVPISMLPEICDSSGVFSYTKGLEVLPDGIPISGIAGDQQSALFGQACYAIGEAKCTFGTGSFLLLNTGEKPVHSKHRMLTTVAWRLPKQKMQYALEGSAFICGAAVQWLRDGLGIIHSSSEVESLAHQVPDSGGVEFVPALTGLGAPHWRADARGVICGLTRGSTKAHIARATLEAMALQNTDILLAMQRDLKKKLKTLKVDGGATANNLLMQIQSDYLGVPIVRPQMIETTALGAAYLAGLGVGLWKDQKEIQKIWQKDKEFKPQMNLSQRKKRFETWQKALQKA